MNEVKRIQDPALFSDLILCDEAAFSARDAVRSAVTAAVEHLSTYVALDKPLLDFTAPMPVAWPHAEGIPNWAAAFRLRNGAVARLKHRDSWIHLHEVSGQTGGPAYSLSAAAGDRLIRVSGGCLLHDYWGYAYPVVTECLGREMTKEMSRLMRHQHYLQTLQAPPAEWVFRCSEELHGFLRSIRDADIVGLYEGEEMEPVVPADEPQ